MSGGHQDTMKEYPILFNQTSDSLRRTACWSVPRRRLHRERKVGHQLYSACRCGAAVQTLLLRRFYAPSFCAQTISLGEQSTLAVLPLGPRSRLPHLHQIMAGSRKMRSCVGGLPCRECSPRKGKPDADLGVRHAALPAIPQSRSQGTGPRAPYICALPRS